MKTCRKGLHEYEGRRCRECQNAYASDYRKANSERVRQRKAAWRKLNSERVRECANAWYKAHPGYRAAWYKANSERHREQTKLWRQEHPEQMRALVYAWAREHVAEYREMGRRSSSLRRARKSNAQTEPITKEHLKLLFDAQDGCCRYCRTPLGKDKHLDHRTPLARGGSHSPSNVCWSCPSCNTRKHVKTEQEFLNG